MQSMKHHRQRAVQPLGSAAALQGQEGNPNLMRKVQVKRMHQHWQRKHLGKISAYFKLSISEILVRVDRTCKLFGSTIEWFSIDSGCGVYTCAMVHRLSCKLSVWHTAGQNVLSKWNKFIIYSLSYVHKRTMQFNDLLASLGTVRSQRYSQVKFDDGAHQNLLGQFVDTTQFSHVTVCGYQSP